MRLRQEITRKRTAIEGMTKDIEKKQRQLGIKKENLAVFEKKTSRLT